MHTKWTTTTTALLTIAATVSCGSNAIGERRDLDADDVSAYAQRDGFTVPEEFDFVRGHTVTEIAGQAAWSAQYTAPAASP